MYTSLLRITTYFVYVDCHFPPNHFPPSHFLPMLPPFIQDNSTSNNVLSLIFNFYFLSFHFGHNILLNARQHNTIWEYGIIVYLLTIFGSRL